MRVLLWLGSPFARESDHRRLIRRVIACTCVSVAPLLTTITHAQDVQRPRFTTRTLLPLEDV